MASRRGDTTQVVAEEPTAPRRPVTQPLRAPVGEPPPSRDLWPWLLVLLVLVIAGLVGAWLATRHHDHSSTRTSGIQTAGRTPGQPSVPSLVGRRAPAALAALRRAHLAGDTRGVFSAKPRDQVVAQQPAARAIVATGSTVMLDVSKGPRPVPVPDVSGQHVATAIETLKAQGLKAGVVRVPSDQPAGQVVAQHPQAGATAAAGSVVRLNASSGQAHPRPQSPAAPGPTAAPVTVPEVAGQKLPEARKTLRRAGLVTEVRSVPSSLPKNTVVAQSPTAGTTAKRTDH